MNDISLTDEQRRYVEIWEDRSRYGRFLEWLATDKKVIPCMNFSALATEFALKDNQKKRN